MRPRGALNNCKTHHHLHNHMLPEMCIMSICIDAQALPRVPLNTSYLLHEVVVGQMHLTPLSPLILIGLKEWVLEDAVVLVVLPQEW